MELYNPKYIDYLLENPGESSKADYKSAVEFKEGEEFSVKLVKHILGFANSGGGYIVIGFNDGDLTLDPNLTEAVTNSYDTTRLSQHVNPYISNAEKILLSAHKKEKNGKIVPIIFIQPFSKYPYFCSDKAKKNGYGAILKENSIYYRDEEAKTTELINEAQFKKIIDQCVRNRHNEILKEFTELLEKATGKTLSEVIASKERSSNEWIAEAKDRAKQALENVRPKE